MSENFFSYEPKKRGGNHTTSKLREKLLGPYYACFFAKASASFALSPFVILVSFVEVASVIGDNLSNDASFAAIAILSQEVQVKLEWVNIRSSPPICAFD